MKVEILNFSFRNSPTRLVYKSYQDRSEPFVLKPNFLMENIIKQQVPTQKEANPVQVTKKKGAPGSMGRVDYGKDEVPDKGEIGW
ncbi:MAG: hypothetical protein HQL08_10035 [Nitrospirae bacterium]|nr:hypothetical protein [Nitrospirota bacterium]